METNTYVIWNPASRDALVIDPGDAPPEFWAWLRARRLQVEKIINTHGHADHIAGNAAIKHMTGAALWIHAADRHLLTDPAANLSLGLGQGLISPTADEVFGRDGSCILGDTVFKVLETPGHTPGSVCLLVGDTLFSGDTLFAGTAGRTDLPGGDFRLLQRSLKTLRTLPKELQVLPGHGAPTILGREIATNPFLQEGRYDET
ncbi:MAG: MBL fold metallo-hydrolase [Candidatus Firestonebacteria bacterium]|nr:MBL fold metallo-hydrolase [Candidatus Firestonebacteria bacterium]